MEMTFDGTNTRQPRTLNRPGHFTVWISYMGVIVYSFIGEQSIENC